jgi:hypothetical protein
MAANMRTLGTQVRLRRLIRVHGEVAARLLAEPENRELAAAGVARLLAICSDVRELWNAESAPGPDDVAVRRHVTRALTALEVAVAELRAPGADVARLSIEFQDAAVPLVYMLRGLEDANLARSA